MTSNDYDNNVCLVTEAEFALRAEAKIDDMKATDMKQRSGDGQRRHPDARNDDPGMTAGTVDTEAQRASHGQQPVCAQHGNCQHARRYCNSCQHR